VRAHARGRDLRFDLVAEEPVEDYLLEAWPEDPAEPHTVQVTSRIGRQLDAKPYRGSRRQSPTHSGRPPRQISVPRHTASSSREASRSEPARETPCSDR